MGFQESDTPNFTGSYYSHCKAIVENLLKVGAALLAGWPTVLAGATGGGAVACDQLAACLREAASACTHCSPLTTYPPTHPISEQEFPNVLTLRVRMPIVADMTYPRNFITKIIK